MTAKHHSDSSLLEVTRLSEKRNDKRIKAVVAGFALIMTMVLAPTGTIADDDLLGIGNNEPNAGEDNECREASETCLVVYDLDELRGRIREGHLELVLFETNYTLELEVIPPDDFQTDDDQKSYDFDAGFGDISNKLENNTQENSTAFILVGSSGVSGFIKTSEKVISFTPHSEIDNKSEPEATIIAQKAIEQESDGTQEEEDEVEASTHHYDANLIVMVDKEYRDRHNLPVTWAKDVIRETNRVFARAGDEYPNLDVPQFAIWEDTIWRCSVCTSTTASTLTKQLGNRIADLCKGSWDCEDDERIAGHLLTGKKLDNGISGGNADLPGRYSVSLAVDTYWSTSRNIQYHKGGSVVEEAAQLAAHELGHNFAGEHVDSERWFEENHAACTNGPVYGPNNNNQYYGCVWMESRYPEAWEWSWAGCSDTPVVQIGHQVIGFCPTYTPWESSHATIMRDGHYQNPKEDANGPDEVFYNEYEFSHTNRVHFENCMFSGSSGGSWEKWEHLPLEPSNGPYDNKCTFQHSKK